MEDEKIVALYWERSQAAIAETQKKYGKYCHFIAYRILNSNPDAEECVNDAYLSAWNAMPPHKPQRLCTFLAKLTRNKALNRYFHEHAKKRCPETNLILDEAEQMLPAATDASFDEVVLRDLLNRFLEELPKEKRILFVQRYWHFYSVKEIAQNCGRTENNVKVILSRARTKLKNYLQKEGIPV